MPASIDYTFRINKRAKRLSLTVYPDGRVVAVAPRKVQQDWLDRFVSSRADWITRTQARFARMPKSLHTTHTKKQIEGYKKVARSIALERLAHFSEIYGLTYSALAIRNQKTRWGSCSRRGTISLNYRLALLPPHLVEYVVVHELCHRKEMNHSPRFWKLVGQTVPDYAERRKALRTIAV